MYLDSEGRTIFTGVRPEDFAPFAVMTVRDALNFTTDPANEIGALLEDCQMVGQTLMYSVSTGSYKGTRVSIISTGTGGPSRELAMADLISNDTQTHTVIDIGSCGTYQGFVEIGDLTISLGEVRDEGTTKEYIDLGYPAVANYEVVMALVEAAEKLGFGYHVGITRSDDSIYLGSGVPVRGYLPRHQKGVAEHWRQAGVINVQREAALNLVMCNLFGLRGGSVRHVGRNFVSGEHESSYPYSIENAYRTALEAIVLLARWDADKERSGRTWWTPSVSYPAD
ncbi:MAG: uridine phosphorylase [bacterium]